MRTLNTGRPSSRQNFVTFAIMWMVIVGLTVVAALFISLTAAKSAKADVLMPLMPMVKVTTPAHITEFTEPASPSRIEAECQPLLSPTNHTAGQRQEQNQSVSWGRRNAGTGDAIQAIKSYRDCARAVALDELARN